jgi:hypothetical protein
VNPAGAVSPVTLHVWRVAPVRLPAVLWRMARDRRRLRGTPAVRFAKLLGTGRSDSFGPARIDPTRWATLVAWDDPGADLETTPVGRAWLALSSACCRIDLTPLASRGTWAGHNPFTPSDGQVDPDGQASADGQASPGGPAQPVTTDRPVLAITRARLRPSQAYAFWRAIGDVGPPAARAPGLLATFGVGEAPIGWQGTVSVWRDARDLVEFAYRQPDHRKAIEQTAARRWYAEELFARFAVLDVTGDRSLIGWTHDRQLTCQERTML